MNNTIQRKERVESIGGITPEIALKQAFAIEHEDEIAMFYGKTILDVGAGFSDLLHHISEYSEPARMVAVDPIYGGQEADATMFTLNSIEKFIDEILSSSDASSDAFLLQMRANAERQKEAILNYGYQNTEIERYKDIPDNIGADIAFVINVLYAAKDPKVLLENMDNELHDDGEIVIIDYTWRGNNINKKLENAGIAIRQFEQYFIAKLRKGDASRIDWNK